MKRELNHTIKPDETKAAEYSKLRLTEAEQLNIIRTPEQLYEEQAVSELVKTVEQVKAEYHDKGDVCRRTMVKLFEALDNVKPSPSAQRGRS